jgi:transcriptional regulator with XRE-family HTH domain
MTEDLGGKIKQLRKRLGMNQTHFGKLTGVDQSTVTKWEKGHQSPSREATARIAELSNQSIEEFMGLKPQEKRRRFEMRSYPHIGEVQAGVWKESFEWPLDEQELISVPVDPDFPDLVMKCITVRGPSMNRIYPEGTQAFVAPTIINRLTPRNGDRVLVTRRNHDGLYESTLKEFVVDADGKVWLWPRSHDPEYQAPILYKNTDTEEVTVAGIVKLALMT